MCFRTLFATGLLAASLPLTSVAQTTTPAPRFYAGLGVSLLTDAPFVGSGSSTILGPALAAGVQLSPRWAVQAGAALAWRNQNYSTTYSLPSGPSPILQTYDVRIATLTVPVLARYTFAPSAKRFHVDALGGAHGAAGGLYLPVHGHPARRHGAAALSRNAPRQHHYRQYFTGPGFALRPCSAPGPHGPRPG
ncbi:hypothetical protein [Hymenobacter bucti]|uniref:Outer membrane protein beta-barrel domain-containing protein n=1 Tax=Hymenobacter bucti TaxID=1844114 RepID=A0ABW4QTD4_9BACT